MALSLLSEDGSYGMVVVLFRGIWLSAVYNKYSTVYLQLNSG